MRLDNVSLDISARMDRVALSNFRAQLAHSATLPGRRQLLIVPCVFQEGMLCNHFFVLIAC
jgi:hypothetical protein